MHLGHKNIIKYCNRPFGTVEQMDSMLIEAINKFVKEKDTLYILGDFCMYGSYNKRNNYRKQINCKDVHLIIGNHDTRLLAKGKQSPFQSEQDYKELKYNKTLFCLSHYPFSSWHNIDRGAIMLHGHIHSEKYYNRMNKTIGMKKYDVGVDANGYSPVSIDEIMKSFEDIISY